MLAATAGVLHLLGVGGYRSGFLGVFVPLAAVSSLVAWLLLRHRLERLLWAAALLVTSATLAGLLVAEAPPSRGVLLAEARELVPPFYDEVSAETDGHSWCRPACPSATLVLDPPDVGAPAIMLEIATPLFVDGLLSEAELAEISRRRSFTVQAPTVTYRVALEGDGRDRRLHLSVESR